MINLAHQSFKCLHFVIFSVKRHVFESKRGLDNFFKDAHSFVVKIGYYYKYLILSQFFWNPKYFQAQFWLVSVKPQVIFFSDPLGWYFFCLDSWAKKAVFWPIFGKICVSNCRKREASDSLYSIVDIICETCEKWTFSYLCYNFRMHCFTRLHHKIQHAFCYCVSNL